MTEVTIHCVGLAVPAHPMSGDVVATFVRGLVVAHAAELRAERFEHIPAALVVRDGSPLSDSVERWAAQRPVFRRTLGDVLLIDATDIEREIAFSARPVGAPAPRAGRRDVVVIAANRPTWASLPAKPSKGELLLAAVRAAHPQLASLGVDALIAELPRHAPFNFAAHVAAFGES